MPHASTANATQFPRELLRRCWFLAGPTAAGKTDVALAIAERLRTTPGRIEVEIVSLDSMSLFRRMDIGTAKPTLEQRRTVPHHLIDILEPSQEFSVAEYLEAALSACRDITDRGKTPLFVGGTGLYLRSVLRGVFSGPPADWNLRRSLAAEAEGRPPAYLHERLQQVDPQTAARLHPNDRRRIVRALEVYHTTGRPLSQQQEQQPLPEEDRPRHVYWLAPARDWLYERINLRVEKMLEAGLVDEVRSLLAEPEPLSRTARQGLGYKEVIDHLEGRLSDEECIERIKTRTRQFAKRQHTWFRNLEECTAIETTGAETATELAARLLIRLYGNHQAL